MSKYYDVIVRDKERNRDTSFIADSFTVAGNRLFIKSERFGNATVQN